MAKIVSLINLKGGVGKTTMTVALAEFLTFKHDKKVLVVDLDPQTNATVMLIDQDMWKDANDNNRTICQMFKDKIDGTNLFDIRNSIIKGVSNVKVENENLDLLPSSINLMDIQDSLPLINTKTNFAQSPITVLASYLNNDIINYYDYILIDCPPNLGLITLNGIFLSDYYLVPVIPDILSTYGIPQIIGRIKEVSKDFSSINRYYNIKPLGLIITKYRKQSSMHNRTIKDLKSRNLLDSKDKMWVPELFNDIVKETNNVSEATDIDKPINTLKQKYGYNKEVYDAFEGITNEFIHKVI